MSRWSRSSWHDDERDGWQCSPQRRSRITHERTDTVASGLTADEVVSKLAENGVRDIYAELYGDWSSDWSAWQEQDWLFEDGYHFNIKGQDELRWRFQDWLDREVRQHGWFDILVADSLFYTHDRAYPRGNERQDIRALKSFGFDSVLMKCGKGFVRKGGFWRLIQEATRTGELVVPQGARVLLVTAGNDMWCDPEERCTFQSLAAHIQWVRDVMKKYAAEVHMVSLIDPHRDWHAW